MFRCLDCSWHFVSPVFQKHFIVFNVFRVLSATTFSTIFAFILSALMKANALRVDVVKKKKKKKNEKER